MSKPIDYAALSSWCWPPPPPSKWWADRPATAPNLLPTCAGTPRADSEILDCAPILLKAALAFLGWLLFGAAIALLAVSGGATVAAMLAVLWVSMPFCMKRQ